MFSSKGWARRQAWSAGRRGWTHGNEDLAAGPAPSARGARCCASRPHRPRPQRPVSQLPENRASARGMCVMKVVQMHITHAVGPGWPTHHWCSWSGLVESLRGRWQQAGGHRLARAIEHSATAGNMVATTFEPSSAASPRKNRLRTPRAHPSRTGREWPVTAGMKRSYRSSCARHRARARVRDGKQGGTAATRHTPATSSLLDDLTRKGCHHDLPQGRPHARARRSHPR